MTDPRNETDPLPNGWTWEQAIEAAYGRLNQEQNYSGLWQQTSEKHENRAAVLTVARLIAQHEKPPVDEATEVWERAYKAYARNFGTCTGGKDAIAIIRDALAKARAGK